MSKKQQIKYQDMETTVQDAGIAADGLLDMSRAGPAQYHGPQSSCSYVRAATWGTYPKMVIFRNAGFLATEVRPMH